MKNNYKKTCIVIKKVVYLCDYLIISRQCIIKNLAQFFFVGNSYPLTRCIVVYLKVLCFLYNSTLSLAKGY